MTKELAKKLKERAKEHEREARMLESRKYGTKWKELTERLFDLRDEYPELSGRKKKRMRRKEPRFGPYSAGISTRACSPRRHSRNSWKGGR